MTEAIAVSPWLENWKLALQGWSRDGSLARAAEEALNLDGVALELQRLIGQWSDAQWHELPPIELLGDEAMPGAAGAYAISTGTIYLNQSWLESASAKQVQAVLTEELGHHLDGLLNAVDTQGDEGDVFAQLLAGSAAIRQVKEEDEINIRLGDQLIRAEASTDNRHFQAVYTDLGAFLYVPGSTFDVPILYYHGPEDADLTGISVSIYWDSSEVTLSNYDLFQSFLLGYGIVDDSIDDDNDPETDKVLGLTYVSFLGGFPYASLPTTLATLQFSANEESSQANYISSLNIKITPSTGFEPQAWSSLFMSSVGIDRSSGNSIEVAGEESTIFFLDENSGAGQRFSIAEIMGNTASSYRLYSFSGDDENFGIDELTGEITMLDDPDYESKSGYSFMVVAATPDGYIEERVTILINNNEDEAPVISSESAIAIDENIGVGQVVYVAEAIDESPIAFDLRPGEGDASSFKIDQLSGEVTLLVNPDYEFKSSYAFTVIATDTAGQAAEQEVTITVNDIDDHAPVFTSLPLAMPIDENSGSGQIIYTAEAIDESSISYSLKPDIGDASFFSIDDLTGEVVLQGDPDYELKLNYLFTVVATDAAGNVGEQAVTLAIRDVDENSPVFTSLPSAAAIDENTGSGQIIYTAKATDESSFNYDLMPDEGDIFAFSIDSSSGDVLLLANPDFESKTHYRFTVVATDAEGNKAEQEVTLAINDLDEDAPVFVSPTSATAINENKAAGQIIYTAETLDESTVAYSLRPGASDSFAFSIDEVTGEVKLKESPDYESKSIYVFAVVATDADGNMAEQLVSLAINDLSEIVHNHAPSGELLITGLPRPEAIITLDAATIEDEDGIDSGFTYGWQVFKSETNTWFELTNPDATDGDGSYTLTNDDQGALFRAQVSYVDGNGLTETISSEPFLVRAPFIVPDIYQSVSTSSEEIAYRPGGSIHLPLIYNVSTGNANLSGLTLNVHYDSSLLAPEGDDHGVRGMIDAAITTTADLPDIDDLDDDPLTDRMVQLVWVSFDNSFPDQDLPLQLANVSFQSLEDPSAPIDSLTGSRISFTAPETSVGYDFLLSTTTLTPRGFDLDVDGDGEVAAFGDGVMIIRKLLGPAFAGDKLTDKAISPYATRTTEEIHQFIQDGIDAGDLDVDQDGRTTALGDGLMVIRRLFGVAFAGDKLTDGVISPDSPYYEEDNAWELVAANIDALIPF